MEHLDAKRIFDQLHKEKIKYCPGVHCPMVLRVVSTTGRETAFCKELNISIVTFHHWLGRYSMFKECFGIAMINARETWESEYDERKDDEAFNKKEWLERGTRTFKLNATTKLHLNITPNSTPYEQYQQIMEQSTTGQFTATEIKLLMESINVGTRVYESFQLQQEVDKMKDDLVLMGQRGGNNIVAITKTS